MIRLHTVGPVVKACFSFLDSLLADLRPFRRAYISPSVLEIPVETWQYDDASNPADLSYYQSPQTTFADTRKPGDLRAHFP